MSLSTKVYEAVRKQLIEGREDSSNVNRASAASRCVRARWYDHNGFVGKALEPRGALVFAFGDLIEHLAKNLIEQSGFYSETKFGDVIGKFTVQRREYNIYSQPKFSTKISEAVLVSGHPDGVGRRAEDGKWELIEIKSAASFSFESFERGEDPDYVKQCHALVMSEEARALSINEFRLFYMNKNTCHLADRLYQFNPGTADLVAKEYLLAVERYIPTWPYEEVKETFRGKVTGRVKLPWQCSYCSHVDHCRTDFEMVIEKSKPIYLKKGATHV